MEVISLDLIPSQRSDYFTKEEKKTLIDGKLNESLDLLL